MDLIAQRWHRYHYKNLTYLLLSVIGAFFLFSNDVFRSYILHLGTAGYIGAFFAGMLFVSTFTVSFGTIILLVLAKSLHPVGIGIIAGIGAVVADLTIFHYIRSRSLLDEIIHFFKYFGGDNIRHLSHTKYFSWMLPVIGAIIIASPLPDEFGVGLLGVSKMKPSQFMILSFGLNSIGIFLVVTAGRVLG